MALRDGLFVHWPLDPERLQPHVPAPLELDTYDGDAWITVVAFVLADAGLRRSPSFTRLTVPECNVRTYVRFDDTRGLYFASVDVDSRVIPPIVRSLSDLSCYRADIDVDRSERTVAFRSRRSRSGDPPALFEASYCPDGDVFRAERGTLDHWLAERRRMFDRVGDAVLYADIAHDRWPLQAADATVRGTPILEANGLTVPDRDPRVRYTAGLPLTGSVPRRICEGGGSERVRPRELTGR